MSYVSHVSISPDHKLTSLTSPSLLSQVAAYEDSVGAHLATLLQSDQHSDVISSAKVLCETIKSLIMKVGKSWREASGIVGEGVSIDPSGTDDSLSAKCMILNDKLDLLLRALREESIASMSSVSTNTQEESSGVDESPETSLDLDGEEKVSLCKDEKNSTHTSHRKRHNRKHFIEKDALMSRANSLKKAVREIIEHTEKALDDQNEQTAARQHQPPPTITLQLSEDEEIYSTVTIGQILPTIAGSSVEVSPCLSPVPPKGLSPFMSSITTNFPLPPASPLPLSTGAQSLPSVCVTDNQSSSTFLQLPGSGSPPRTPIVDPLEQLRVDYHCISPLPDRRESQNEFEFPPTLPVPSEFADLSRKNSMQEPKDIPEGPSIPIEDIEVRIKSSTDNLVEVGDDDEPYAFEEKSISEIRDSLASSLNNSVDIDEDWEDIRKGDAEGETELHEGIDEEENAEGDEDKEKTETADSDETDDTVRETRRCESKEGGNLEDTSPEGDVSVAEATSVNSITDPDTEDKKSTDELVELPLQRETPYGEETQIEATTPTVPLAEEEQLENLEDEEENVPPSSERYVEGAEAMTDDDELEEEKGMRESR
ncbi:hypothetical protein SK128_025520 [Halocaridina rubra]|uniref:Uncharacterized protein n=1 Tax=Halocaridina rubra TaxID=373956 RepID=A0AAN8XQP9_HALRR